ncbi:MAG: hypothetical protein HWE21_02390 [Cytophagia bacterium]|nr:hypothetical protein [Cytophagia bacterium]
MRRRISVQVFGVLGALFFLYSCQTSEYAKLEKAELAKGVRYDSLFHGIKFGTSKGDFYQICWDKNKEGILNAGGYKNYIRYELKGDTAVADHIIMYFYPDYDTDENITGMDVEFLYSGWSPGNSVYYSDKLMSALKDTLMTWYGGNEFLKLPSEEEFGEVLVKVDGNRRIAIKQKDDQRVQMKIADLTATK